MAHVIRLRGFWTIAESAAGRRHERSFGRPGRLDAGERAWLVCSHVPGPTEVSVNGQVVGVASAGGRFEADVTDQLAGRNIVAFTVVSGQPLGEVALEIRD